MSRIFAALFLCLLTLDLALAEVSLENGALLNRNCALCHGHYGEGSNRANSPRLAGLSESYLIKSLEDYRAGKRHNSTMYKSAGIELLSDTDIRDIAAYLHAIDLSSDPRFNVRQFDGDPQAGKLLFNDECRHCHMRDGLGQARKQVPRLAGQHVAYLLSSIERFKSRQRLHDNDPDDRQFEEYSDRQLRDITAYIATLDDPLIEPQGVARVPGVVTRPASERIAVQHIGGLEIASLGQTLAQLPLEPGVTREQAVEAMLLRAQTLNLQLVEQREVSGEMHAAGVKSPYLTIFQFCTTLDVRTLVLANPLFASYMPCRIALFEDEKGASRLMLLNLDILLNSRLMSPEVVESAIEINQSMLDIMVAGASGHI